MKRTAIYWVVFVLAMAFWPLAGSAIGPVASEVALPAAIQNKAIWTIAPLTGNRLAIGFEGGLAIGTRSGKWELIASPNGQTVQTISQQNGRILVAGSGFCSLLNGNSLVQVGFMEGEYTCSEPVDDGWLVAGKDGLWLVSTDAKTRRILPQSTNGTQTRIARIGTRVVVTSFGMAPQSWEDGQLVPVSTLKNFTDTRIYWSANSILATNLGLLSTDGDNLLSPEDNRTTLAAGIVGLATAGPLMIVPTFNDGLRSFETATGAPAGHWRAISDIYCIAQTPDGILIGTAKGLIALADPWAQQKVPLDNEGIIRLLVDANDSAWVVTPAGSIPLSDFRVDPATRSSEQWPEIDGANVTDKIFRFSDTSIELPSRFVSGLATSGTSAAVAMDHGIVILKPHGEPISTSLPGGLRSLASDGQRYLAATNSQGVHVLAPDGRIIGRIGSGRAFVREMRPGKVALIFWDGTIRDSDSILLGRIQEGNPRDIALVQGRIAVLVTKPDREPVIGFLEGDTFQPLEIPGLADIGAEQIVATNHYLIAAGPRGVIRTRLPLAASKPPAPDWKWSAAASESHVTLSKPSEKFIQIAVESGESAPAPKTYYRVRAEESWWTEVEHGTPVQIPIAWGKTVLSIQSERNGLRVDQTFTVVRPWPWWLRAWAWPLHAAAAAGLILGASRIRTRRLEQRNRELERRVANRTEELRKANAAKEEFLAGISHEIRNPLNGVVGICAMLADREVGPREKMLVRTLGGCADQLRSMLDDILDFSRIERGDVSVTNQDFELAALIEESSMIMDPERSACTLILPDEPMWLHGDSGKLRQIACNLISNALKYGVPREAGVEVRVENAGGGRSRIRIAVRNSGPTIPAEEIPRLFESFQRGSRTAGIPGSGLGLAVCRRLIQSMGGRITAASVDGVTEFAIEVLLPNARPPEKTAELPAMVSRALAIEDEDYNRIALGHVLRALGYQVDWAADGASALKLAGERQYDLVLTDWRLPDMDGGDLCKRILSLLPNPKPPVIAVTAYSTTEKLDEARAAGMTGFVTKPITKEKLSRVIRGLSEGLQPRRSLDINLAAAPASPLASLGDLAPSCEQLASDIAARWRSTTTMAELRDPRTPREAHALRSLLLLASEEGAAEQIALIENAAESADWPTVDKLLPFAAEEIAQTRQRLTA